MEKSDWLSSGKIYVSGHSGLVGRALVRALGTFPSVEIVSADRSELDLRDRVAVDRFLSEHRPGVVIIAAATVGGIHANNSRPAEFIHNNLAIANNLIDASYRAGITRLLYLGSSCIYPRLATQPMDEGQLMQGYLEPTNEPYAIAKIAGIKLCESYNRQYGTDYRCVMPTNLYGPFDTFDLSQGHVIPALMRRLHEAKVNGASEVAIWGTGNARREFLYVDDLAAGCIAVMQESKKQIEQHTLPQRSHINIGTGNDVTIAQLARLIANVVGFTGDLRFDTSKPDGTPKKLLDTRLINSMGWKPKTGLEEGLRLTYQWFNGQPVATDF